MSNATGDLKAWLPRSLLRLPPGTPIPTVRADGLTAVRLRWQDGRLQCPEPLPATEPAPSRLVLPRGVDPHVHLDKVFTWDRHPNLAGTYDGALQANLEEHATRTRDGVLERGHRAMTLACAGGLRAMRSHIDSLGPGAACSWEALVELREHWRDRLELQLVALVPIEHWGTPDGEALAERVAAVGGLLGGVLVPPCGGSGVRRSLAALLRLAQRLGCAVDLHIDESDHHPGQGLQQLLRVLEGASQSPVVTCSHASSLGLLSKRAIERMAQRMAAQKLRVVALPLTNGWLLGRQQDATPVLRPLALLTGK